MTGANRFDVIVVGAGSAGCACAARLAELGAGRVALIEAGPPDRGLLVRMPFGLIWLMGSRRDWRFATSPQAALDGRRVSVPRGRLVGGSGSINSMVWFRGRRADFDAWGLEGWRAEDVWPAFDDVEARMPPSRIVEPHPLSVAFGRTLGGDGETPPDPERESAGVFAVNMRGGRRWSAADGYLRGAGVVLMTDRSVDRVLFSAERAVGVLLTGGEELSAHKGVVLAAGAIGSPAIALRSGIGPREDLAALGIDTVADSDGVGANLHDHPAVPLHFAGGRSGYGLTLAQAPAWAMAPMRWMLTGGGPLGSNTVEAGAFLDLDNDGVPDAQVHFIPAHLGWQGRSIVPGKSGYYADVCLCRPASRGRLRLASRDPDAPPVIDPRLLQDGDDFDLLVRAFRRLRRLMDDAPFGAARAQEAFPGAQAQSDDAIRAHVRARCGTAYHPVGTLRMGDDGPVTPRLAVKGVRGLFVADASVVPSITSANTNAPAIMIGHRAGQMIAEDLEAA